MPRCQRSVLRRFRVTTSYEFPAAESGTAWGSRRANARPIAAPNSRYQVLGVAIWINLVTENGRFLRHRPKRSEQCLRITKDCTIQPPIVAKETSGVPEGPLRKNHVARIYRDQNAQQPTGVANRVERSQKQVQYGQRTQDAVQPKRSSWTGHAGRCDLQASQ